MAKSRRQLKEKSVKRVLKQGECIERHQTVLDAQRGFVNMTSTSIPSKKIYRRREKHSSLGYDY